MGTTQLDIIPWSSRLQQTLRTVAWLVSLTPLVILGLVSLLILCCEMAQASSRVDRHRRGM